MYLRNRKQYKLKFLRHNDEALHEKELRHLAQNIIDHETRNLRIAVFVIASIVAAAIFAYLIYLGG